MNAPTERKLPRLLPIDPLLPWIKECCERETVESFAARCGISAKRVCDFTAGRVVRIQFDSLDKMIAKEGSRSIIDFFPEYDDAEAFAECENAFVKRIQKKGCDIEGCEDAHHSKGLCNRHYLRKTRRKKAA
jgi:hypothetical protein